MPSFLMVLSVLVEILILTVLFPSSQKNFRVCRLTCWTLCVCALDFETFMALLFCLVPARSHFRSRITRALAAMGDRDVCNWKAFAIAKNSTKKCASAPFPRPTDGLAKASHLPSSSTAPACTLADPCDRIDAPSASADLTTWRCDGTARARSLCGDHATLCSASACTR